MSNWIGYDVLEAPRKYKKKEKRNKIILMGNWIGYDVLEDLRKYKKKEREKKQNYINV